MLRKFSSIFLAMMAVVGILFSIPTKIYANENSSENEIITKKTAVLNEDGTYTINLESYATGERIISEVSKNKPTDIVLVLDQSGSMAKNDFPENVTISFNEKTNYTNKNLYLDRHNTDNGLKANLYYKVDDHYVSVYVKTTPVGTVEDYVSLSEETSNYSYLQYSNENNLFALIDGNYVNVNVTRKWNRYTYTYTYSFSGYQFTSNGSDNTPSENMLAYLPLFIFDSNATDYKYEYYYNDESQNPITIVESVGNNTNVQNDLNVIFYSKLSQNSENTMRRLTALTNAVTSFVESVAKKAEEDNVDHRIAIAGFSSQNSVFYEYNNTELLSVDSKYISETADDIPADSDSAYFPNRIAYNGPYYYDSINETIYKNSLQDMSSEEGIDNVKSAIGYLTAYGGTQIQAGIDMANNIFENNEIDYKERNRVIIVFTDGAPGNNGDWRSSDLQVANEAINNANKSKNIYNATVYTVGIFDSANGENPSVLPDFTDPVTYGTMTKSKQTLNSNRFMHLLSSNYLNSKSMTETGSVNKDLRKDGYFLSASNSQALSNIFEKISSQIDNESSSTKLDDSAIVKDIISPQFNIDVDEDNKLNISVSKYACTDVDTANKKYNFDDDPIDTDATVTYNEESQTVKVTGFDFSENWCGVEENQITHESIPRGYKLVISITVKAKDGFLGGNNVYTNDSAGIYVDENATDPVVIFNKPQVNVPINYNVTAPDYNVYVRDSISGEELLNGANLTFGSKDQYKLDMTQATNSEHPYGLEQWQTQYVNMDVQVLDKSNETAIDISDKGLNNIEKDGTYYVAVKIIPKTNGLKDDNGNDLQNPNSMNPEAKETTGKITVFKPTVSVNDIDVYYSDTTPTLSQKELENTITWLSDAKKSSKDVTMNSTEPRLSLDYTCDKSLGTTINTKDNIFVKVNVSRVDGDVITDITEYSEFTYNTCMDNISENGDVITIPEDYQFMLHNHTCNMTIKKTGGESNEPYIFTIFKDGKRYTEASITGNGTVDISELPVGNYTVEEDTDWSWRYRESGGIKPEYQYTNSKGGTKTSAILSSTNPSSSVTVTNTKNFQYWLNGFSKIVQNIFGKTASAE